MLGGAPHSAETCTAPCTNWLQTVGARSYIPWVTIGDVTRAGVLAAVEEFDRLGRDAFLASAGFGSARSYFLEHGGRLYDSKAIVGFAHRADTGDPLGPEDFSGGDHSVARRLEALGFTVLNLLRPDWTRKEIILACALAESVGWRQVDRLDPAAKELSQLLQSPAVHPLPHHPDFRNPSGIEQKTRNILDHHPDHRGRPRSNGNHLDKEIFDEFFANSDKMRAEAALIREEFLAAANSANLASEVTVTEAVSPELPDSASFHAADTGNRVQRREQVRSRVERVLGKPLQESGSDYSLADGRRVAIYYSKIHSNGTAYLGIPNRLRDDDIIILLLGDESHPEHLVFPRAEALTRYKRALFKRALDDLVSEPSGIVIR